MVLKMKFNQHHLATKIIYINVGCKPRYHQNSVYIIKKIDMHINKLQIAIDKATKELVSIYNVPVGENCNCKCPGCGKDLEARNRNKTPETKLKKNQKIAHFAHIDNKELCETALESAIHLLCKKVIKEYPLLLVPEYHFDNILFGKSELITFDNVDIEQTIKIEEDEIKPDVILYYNQGKILLEFYKTHKVDDTKQEKIKRIKENCIEINVNEINPLQNGEFNINDILKLFQNTLTHKQWLYNIRHELEVNKYIADKNKKIQDEEERLKLAKLYVDSQNQKILDKIEKEKKEEFVKEMRRQGKHLNIINIEDIFIPEKHVMCRMTNEISYISKCEKCSFFQMFKIIDNNKYLIC